MQKVTKRDIKIIVCLVVEDFFNKLNDIISKEYGYDYYDYKDDSYFDRYYNPKYFSSYEQAYKFIVEDINNEFDKEKEKCLGRIQGDLRWKLK